MTIFVGTNGVNVASALPPGLFAGWTTGVIANLLDAIGDTFIALGGNDRVVAGNASDVILGGDGNDFIDGRLGFDVMDGGNGIDTMDVSWFSGGYVWNMGTGTTNFSAGGEFAFNFENALTGAGNDNITGTIGNNAFRTNAGNDTVAALDGNDTISAGAGNDVLAGGAGSDVFIFNTTLNTATNTDRITDFFAPLDTIQLENAIFINLVAGALNPLNFRLGPVALDADDHIIYNAATGELFADSNGNLAGGVARFAQLNPGTVLSVADFFVI